MYDTNNILLSYGGVVYPSMYHIYQSVRRNSFRKYSVYLIITIVIFVLTSRPYESRDNFGLYTPPRALITLQVYDNVV